MASPPALPTALLCSLKVEREHSLLPAAMTGNYHVTQQCLSVKVKSKVICVEAC